MRTIKFRAWDVEMKKHHFGTSNIMIDTAGLVFWQFGNEAPIPVQQRFIIEQYTGFKDSGDKEIYEGDIVTCTEGPMMEMGDYPGLQGPFEVSFKNGSFTIEWNGSYWCILHFPKIKKLGNIHENPELLKEKNDEPET